MIEYTYSLFDLKDVTTTTTRQPNRWAVKLVHKPTGLFATRSGTGLYEHQVDQRRECLEDLKQQVDAYYKDNI